MIFAPSGAGPQAGASPDGQWRGDLKIGSAEASAAVRARIAIAGLFALSSKEAVYMTRATDDAGRPLDPSCAYEMAGGAMAADWWSITLYAEDNYLARNADAAASIQSDAIVDLAAGWRAAIGPDRPSDGTPWLSTSGAQSFDLTLRLYQPDLDALTGPQPPDLPSVRRLRCAGDGA